MLGVLASLILIFGAFSTNSLRAESRPGDALQLTRDADLMKEPYPGSSSQGTLPTGTILTSKGQQRGTWVLVSVELENGDIVEGWIDRDAIAGEVKELESLNSDEKKKLTIKTGRVVVPQDEALLLRREPSFLYGVQAGGNFAFMQAATDELYTGIGMTGGALLGVFVAPGVPIRLELNFSQYRGKAPVDTTELGFNFLDIAIVPSYQIVRFEIFAGLQYSFGLGLNDVPSGIELISAQDLSSVGFQAGAGYRVPIGGGSDFVIRARYTGLFKSEPFIFQGVSLLLGLEFTG